MHAFPCNACMYALACTETASKQCAGRQAMSCVLRELFRIIKSLIACYGCVQVRAFAFAQGGLVAATRLHERLLTAVVAAPAAFFDATPFGRVFNRFSSDVAIVDDALPFILSAHPRTLQ